MALCFLVLLYKMDVLLYNSAVCRLCGEENENGSLLYTCDENGENLCDTINSYMPMKVSDDGQLPRTICPGCVIQLEASVEFLNLIIKGQKIIRELYNREREYKKALLLKAGVVHEADGATEKVFYEINSHNGVYQADHPVALQMAGLDKPKRKRGRPPKKPKTPEELAQEAAEREKKEAEHAASNDQTENGEPSGKRRRKTPNWYREAVQGKELERIFKEEGVIDAEESDPEAKPDIEADFKVPVSKEPEVIGHLETTGEMVVVVKGKGRGRPKGRMRPTREVCSICGMEFSNVGRYMSHVAAHGPVLYQCSADQCQLTFSTRLAFQQHQEAEGHSGQKTLPCKKMQQTPKTEQSTEHRHTNGDSDPKSEEPSSTLPNLDETAVIKSTIDASNKAEEGAKEEVFEIMNTDFIKSLDDKDDSSEVVDVLSSPKKNDEKTDDSSDKELDPLGDIELKGNAKLKCPHCDKMFSNRQSKSMHIKAIHAGERPYVCGECGAAFPYPRSLKVHALSHRRSKPHSRGFACDLCGKILNHPSSVVYHKEAEHAGNQYVCLKCGKGFKHKQLLQRHQLVHSQLRPYTCKTCSATFKTKANLMNHQLLHTGVKKFACEICKQRFAHKTSMTLHMRLHTGLKPFSCNVCGKSFSQKGNLSEHERIHTGEKPYVCSVCPRSFTTSSQHRLHIRRHSAEKPYVCTQCGKRFLSRESWRVHMRREAGTREHRCETCGRAFCERWALLKHVRKHTGERPFHCPHCPRAFADCSNLNKHKKQVHKQISLLVSNKPQQYLPQKPKLPAPPAPAPTPAIEVEEPETRGDKSVIMTDEDGEERVIYVTYDVDDEDAPAFHILDTEQEDALTEDNLYSGSSVLVHEQISLEEQHMPEHVSQIQLHRAGNDDDDKDEIYVEAEEILADQHMAVTDEQGNPLHFTMQDGTRLAITSADGKSLQVITQDGQTIPVEINDVSMEEENEDVIEEHLNIQKSVEAAAPQTAYYTIV